MPEGPLPGERRCGQRAERWSPETTKSFGFDLSHSLICSSLINIKIKHLLALHHFNNKKAVEITTDVY